MGIMSMLPFHRLQLQYAFGFLCNKTKIPLFQFQRVSVHIVFWNIFGELCGKFCFVLDFHLLCFN
jgi:hypothetical protein